MVLAILQARMSSQRLPGKVLQPILGKPMLARQIERVYMARRVDQLVVATSDQPSDKPIKELCDAIGVTCYRGALDDVLDRFYQASYLSPAKHLMRLTGDCPLIDPALIDHMVECYHETGCDYYSNCEQRTFPHGLDIEIFSRRSLETCWHQAWQAEHREHVTLFMRSQPRQFRQGHHTSNVDRSWHRWTVDYPEDFQFVSRVYEELYPDNPRFDRDDVYDLLDRYPQIAAINAHRTERVRGLVA